MYVHEYGRHKDVDLGRLSGASAGCLIFQSLLWRCLAVQVGMGRAEDLRLLQKVRSRVVGNVRVYSRPAILHRLSGRRHFVVLKPMQPWKR